jgi:hypothetical protein
MAAGPQARGAHVAEHHESQRRSRLPPAANMLLGVSDPNYAARDAGPQGRCVCGEKVTIADAHEITLPNGRAGWEGYCPECGAPLFAIRREARPSS